MLGETGIPPLLADAAPLTLPPGAHPDGLAPMHGVATADAGMALDDTAIRPLAGQVQALEQRALSDALAHTGGNKLAAARLLGISRGKLYQLLAEMPMN